MSLEVWILKVYGRIEKEVISKVPFTFPSNNSEFYKYTLDSRRITPLNILEDLQGDEPFLKEFCLPGSGHPQGYIYGWVANDDENLYVAIDLTSDNTLDGDKDYAKVNINTDEGLKTFEITQSNSIWGRTAFVYTDKVEYEHKIYEFVIPLDDMGSGLKDLFMSFTVYGTLSDPIVIDKRDVFVTEGTDDFAVIGLSRDLSTEGDYPGDVTVSYLTVDGNAIDGEDYFYTEGSITFKEGDKLFNIKIPIIDNDIIEYEQEHFIVNVTSSESQEWSFPVREVSVWIRDDDKEVGPPSFSFKGTPYTVNEADGEAIITVKLDGDMEPRSNPTLMISQFNPKVDYRTEDGTATAGLDYTETFGTLEFIDDDTFSFSVPILEDDLVEGNETIQLILYPAEEVYERSSTEKPVIEATLTIIDNDKTPKPDPDPNPKPDPDPDPDPKPEPKPERESDPDPKAKPPKGGVVIRRPEYIEIGDPVEKHLNKKDEVIIKYSQKLLDENEDATPVVCYWNTKYKKWVALTTFFEEEGKAKALLEGKYEGWFKVFANKQPTFIDIDDNMYKNNYLRLNNLGVLEGFSLGDEELRVVLVEQNMTRAEFATLIYRLINLDYDNILVPALGFQDGEALLQDKFSDYVTILPWHRNIVASLAAKNIVEAVDGAFLASKDITVLEAAKMVNSAIEYIPEYEKINFDEFKDDESVAEWAKKALRDETLDEFIEENISLEDTITREDALVILYKLFILGLGW